MYTSNMYWNRSQRKIELTVLLTLVEKNYTIPRLAKYFEVSIASIRKFLKDNDIKIINGNTLYKNLNEKTHSS